MYYVRSSQFAVRSSQFAVRRKNSNLLTLSKCFALLALLLALAAPGWADVAVTKVRMNRTSKTLTVGQTLQLAAEVYPDNAPNKAVTWSVSSRWRSRQR